MKQKNFLDFVPVWNSDNTWDADADNIITVNVVNRGFYNRLAQKLFKRPVISHIKLDRYGSFVWMQIDGVRTIFEISGLVENEFGEEAAPVVPRLVKYFQILYQNRFVKFIKNK